MYRVGEVLLHKKGGKYLVVRRPSAHRRAEHDGKAYYQYTSTNPEKLNGVYFPVIWNRSEDMMEDGRFSILKRRNIFTILLAYWTRLVM